MTIYKTQHPNTTDAINCASMLINLNVKCIRLGSAVVVLSNMHNSNTITNAMHENRGFSVEASEDDQQELLGSI
jgi:selenocysteine lyase/cysteine desulfurase